MGTMIFDMADFQATTFGVVKASFNGIAQNRAFNDGLPSTKLRVFDLDAAVTDQINLTGALWWSIATGRATFTASTTRP